MTKEQAISDVLTLSEIAANMCDHDMDSTTLKDIAELESNLIRFIRGGVYVD